MNMKRTLSGFIIIIIVIIAFFFWKNNYSVPSNLQKLSPKQVVNLYLNACSNGDTETLKKLIYFPPGTTEKQKQKRIDSYDLTRAPEARAILNMMGLKHFAKYETIIDEDSAEVGVFFKAGTLQSLLFGKPSYIWKSYPGEQVILKKDQGVWKYHHNKNNFVSLSDLAEAIKKNPDDSSLYYYYGIHTISENPYRAHKYFKKCYELEPNGFWITEEFLEDLKEFEDIDAYEKMMLNSDAPPGNKSTVYTKLGLCFAECGNYKKAKRYYEKAEDAIKKYPNPLGKERLAKAKKELQLRLEGKHTDILSELDQNATVP